VFIWTIKEIVGVSVGNCHLIFFAEGICFCMIGTKWAFVSINHQDVGVSLGKDHRNFEKLDDCDVCIIY